MGSYRANKILKDSLLRNPWNHKPPTRKVKKMVKLTLAPIEWLEIEIAKNFSLTISAEKDGKRLMTYRRNGVPSLQQELVVHAVQVAKIAKYPKP